MTTTQRISTRQTRAVALVTAGNVRKVKNGWYVRSQSNPRIQYWTDGQSCTCPDWLDRQPKGGCKHMGAVGLWMDRQADDALAFVLAARAALEKAQSPVEAPVEAPAPPKPPEAPAPLTCGHCGHTSPDVAMITAWVGGQGHVAAPRCTDAVACDARWDQAHGWRYDATLGLVAVLA